MTGIKVKTSTKKVYVAFANDYEDSCVWRVFSTQAKADKWLSDGNKAYEKWEQSNRPLVVGNGAMRGEPRRPDYPTQDEWQEAHNNWLLSWKRPVKPDVGPEPPYMGHIEIQEFDLE